MSDETRARSGDHRRTSGPQLANERLARLGFYSAPLVVLAVAAYFLFHIPEDVLVGIAATWLALMVVVAAWDGIIAVCSGRKARGIRVLLYVAVLVATITTEFVTHPRQLP